VTVDARTFFDQAKQVAVYAPFVRRIRPDALPNRRVDPDQMSRALIDPPALIVRAPDSGWLTDRIRIFRSLIEEASR
jgi:hypothetical protein